MKASKQEQCLTIKLNQKMKKNIFISAALAVVAFSSCQQENLGGNDAIADGFRVHAEDTKAVLDGVKVVFEENDAIDIYADGAETPAVYTYNKESDLFVSTGTEAEGAEYAAIFPAQTNKSRSIINIPWKQFATVNSFPKNAMYMAGTSTSKELMLKHLVGLWEIDLLPQYDRQKLVRADLTMNGGQKINGNFEINWSDNTIVYVDEGRSAILLSGIDYVMTAGEPVKLYFALPEGKYEGGFTFTATMTDGTIMDVTSPSTINIVRGQITKVKNDVIYRLFASGTGTENDPYVIKSANHWKNMVTKVNKDAKNYASAYYKLEADIDFKNEVIDSIHVFKGVLDGDNHTLKNVKIGDGSASHQAFFYLLNGTVKNLKFDNITVTGGNATGAASSAAVITAGNSSVAFTIENCHVSNSTIVSGPQDGENGGSYAAGLVGRCNKADAIIRNCSVTNSTIKSTWANAGGVVGYVGNGLMDGILSSNNTVTAENSSLAGGVVAGMGGGTLINIVSKDNVCSVKTTSCGGVVGVCSSNDAKIINVLSDGNTVKSMSNQNIPCLGLILGTDGSTKTTLLANGLVLSGLASYVFTPTIDETDPSKSKLYAGCIGIVMGYPAATIDNCFYNRNYRSKFDTDFTEAAQSANELNYYRMAIGQKRNIITNASWAGYDDDNTTPYLDAPLTDGTCLQQLNTWVEANKTTYPSLKSWAARTSGKTYPEIVLKETATSGVNALNIVESNY